MPKEWRVTTAALLGAASGAIYGLFGYLFGGESALDSPARLIGHFVGSAIGGAFLFALVAWVRNGLVARRPR